MHPSIINTRDVLRDGRTLLGLTAFLTILPVIVYDTILLAHPSASSTICTTMSDSDPGSADFAMFLFALKVAWTITLLGNGLLLAKSIFQALIHTLPEEEAPKRNREADLERARAGSDSQECGGNQQLRELKQLDEASIEEKRQESGLKRSLKANLEQAFLTAVGAWVWILVAVLVGRWFWFDCALWGKGM
ncbi:hypothetical protein MMC30_007252 [Trapelia coarctata]|nr:hypothetical protein [Trapelia coarctata]